MVYKQEVEGGVVYCPMANGRAIEYCTRVRAMQMGRGKKKMIRSCTKALKYTNIL